LKTQEAITKREWTILPHPTYSPYLALEDLKLNWTVKRCHLWGQFWEWCCGFWRSGCEYNIQTATKTLVSRCCKVGGDSCV